MSRQVATITWSRPTAPDSFTIVRGAAHPIAGEVLRLVFATIGGEVRGFICRLFPSMCRHQIGVPR